MNTFVAASCETVGRNEFGWHSESAKRQAIYRFILARIADAVMAEDLTQDVLVKAEKARLALRDPEKSDGWMFRIARNVIADHFRETKRSVFNSAKGASSAAGPDTMLSTQEQENRKAHLLRCIHAFAESLPDNYRVALELVDFEGISQVELAERYGLTISAAKSRVQRARAKLRVMINACCEVDTDVYGNFIDCRRRDNWLPCE
jgi:RNA polymerase sigma-70 factor (ECF subfamily)